MEQPLWKIVSQFLRELNMLLPYDPTFVFFGIYLNGYNLESMQRLAIR